MNIHRPTLVRAAVATLAIGYGITQLHTGVTELTQGTTSSNIPSSPQWSQVLAQFPPPAQAPANVVFHRLSAPQQQVELQRIVAASPQRWASFATLSQLIPSLPPAVQVSYVADLLGVATTSDRAVLAAYIQSIGPGIWPGPAPIAPGPTGDLGWTNVGCALGGGTPLTDIYGNEHCN